MTVTFEIIANISSSLGVIFAAIGIIYLAKQVKDGKKAVEAQTKATEIDTYVTINLEFLDTISNFKEHINNPEIKLADLSMEEIRTIDRYFYLCNIEYILIEDKIIKDNLAEHWLKGIKSAAKRKPFVERWQSSASKYSLNKNFTDFFNNAIEQHQKNENDNIC